MTLPAELAPFFIPGNDAARWNGIGWLRCWLRALPFSGYESHQRIPPGEQFWRPILVLRQIGKGGMGKVFLVVDPVDFDVCVLKVPRDGEELDRFREEVLCHQRASGEGVVGFRGYLTLEGVDPGRGVQRDALLMDYVPGTSLGDLLIYQSPRSASVRRKLPLKIAAVIFRQVVLALERVQKLGFIHRDLHSHNVLIDVRHGLCALINDFGIAKREDRPPTQPLTHGAIGPGARGAAPPEQLDRREVPQSDYFVLGGTLLASLTGQSAFSNAKDATRKERPADLDIVKTQYGPQLQAFLARLLEKGDQDRPNSTAQLASEFEEAMAAASVPKATFWSVGWPKPAATSDDYRQQRSELNDAWELTQILGQKLFAQAVTINYAIQNQPIVTIDYWRAERLKDFSKLEDFVTSDQRCDSISVELKSAIRTVLQFYQLVSGAPYWSADVVLPLNLMIFLWTRCRAAADDIVARLLKCQEHLIALDEAG